MANTVTLITKHCFKYNYHLLKLMCKKNIISHIPPFIGRTMAEMPLPSNQTGVRAHLKIIFG